jgi:hypothetical protein
VKSIIFVLTILMIASNLFWLYRVIDDGITITYQDQRINELEEVREQLMALLPVLARGVKQEAITTIAGEVSGERPFQKHGCLWVGQLGFYFDQEGMLRSVSPAWQTDPADPCLSCAFK